MPNNWFQDRDGLWWQMLPIGPFPEPRELSPEERIEAAANYMKKKLAPRLDQIHIQAMMYETNLQDTPEDPQ